MTFVLSAKTALPVRPDRPLTIKQTAILYGSGSSRQTDGWILRVLCASRETASFSCRADPRHSV